MKIKKFFISFDYILFFTSIVLTIMGIFFIFSANLNRSSEFHSQWIKQVIYLIFSITFLISLLFVATKSIKQFTLVFYIINIIGLFITLFFPEVDGQHRLAIGGLSIQFSEFMKIAMIMFLSSYYSQKSNIEIKSLFTYSKALGILLIPIFLILLQKDMGTMIVYVPIFLGISFIAGVNIRYLLYTTLLIFFITLIPVLTTLNKIFFNGSSIIVSVIMNPHFVLILFSSLSITIAISILAYFGIIKGINTLFKRIFYWYIFFSTIVFIGLLISYPTNSFILKPYQKDRLLIFFNPYYSPDDLGYNIIQSKTSVGNGGLFGNGWCQGEQTQKGFLPAKSTDFIYSVIAEEMGFLGSILILLCYGLIFVRGILIALKSKDKWGKYVIIGILSFLLFHILETMGMSVGIMPITGIPLPFLSYGGSFLIVCFLSVALMMNIELNRYKY